jgi:hypothetical protein
VNKSKGHTGNILILLRIVLVILFGWYYNSLSVYNHAHIINGRVITHSHPFKQDNSGSPFKTHKHSAAGFLLFDKSAGGEALPLKPCIKTDAPVILLFVIKAEESHDFSPVCFTASHPLRAPPLA